MKKWQYTIEGVSGIETGHVRARTWAEADRKVQKLYRKAIIDFGAFRWDVAEKPVE